MEFRGVGVASEVVRAWVKPLDKIVRIGVERREKILGGVTRGGELEYGDGLGVTLEVGSAWVKHFIKMVEIEVERREKTYGGYRGEGNPMVVLG